MFFIFISLIITAKKSINPPINIVRVKGSAKNIIANIAPHNDSVDKMILPLDESVYFKPIFCNKKHNADGISPVNNKVKYILILL